MSWEVLDDFTWKQIFALAIGNNIRRSRTYIPRTYDPLTWRSIRMCCARWRNIVDPCPSIGIMWALLRTIRDNNPVAFETYLREIYEAPMIGGSYSIGNVRAKEDIQHNIRPIMSAMFAAISSRYFRAFIEIYGTYMRDDGCDYDTYFDDQIREYIGHNNWDEMSIREFVDYYSDCVIDWSLIDLLNKRYVNSALTTDFIWRAMYGHRTYTEVTLTSRSRAVNYLIVRLVAHKDDQVFTNVHEVMRAQYSNDEREHIRVRESLDTMAPSRARSCRPVDRIQSYESVIVDSVLAIDEAYQCDKTERIFREYYRDHVYNMRDGENLVDVVKQLAIWTMSHISRESIADRSLRALDKIMPFIPNREHHDIINSYYVIMLSNWLIDDILNDTKINTHGLFPCSIYLNGRMRNSLTGDAIASAICGSVPLREFEVGFAKFARLFGSCERIVLRVINRIIGAWDHIAHPYVILRILLEHTNPYKVRDNFVLPESRESLRAMIDSYIAAK